MWRAIVLLVLSAALLMPANAAELAGQVVDEAGQGLIARVTVVSSTTRASEVAFTAPDGSFRMQVPEGELHVLATRGPEWSIAEAQAQDGQQLSLQLQRLVDMPARGWWGADLHMHSTVSDGAQSPEDVAYACRAEGLQIAALADHNTVDHHPVWLAQRSDDFLPIRGQEVTTKRGHMVAINNPSLISHDISQGEADARRIFRQIREDGGVSIVAHPYVPGHVYQFPEVLDYDAMEILNGSVPPHGAVFDFVQGRKAWHQLLSQGHRIAVVGNSDCHDVTSEIGRRLLRNPEQSSQADWRLGMMLALVDFEQIIEPWGWKGLHVGFYRTYLQMDELSEENVADAVRAGRGFVTNGPLLIATLDGQLPGAEIQLGERERLELAAEMIANRPLERLEILVNGEPQLSVGTSSAAQTAVTVPVRSGDWVVAELYGQWPEFATTNAWYVR